MISTVTSTVITVVTTVSNMYLVTSLGLVSMLILIAFLATRELATASDGTRTQVLSRNLNIPVLALLFVFVVIVVMKVLDALL